MCLKTQRLKVPEFQRHIQDRYHVFADADIKTQIPVGLRVFKEVYGDDFSIPPGAPER